MAFNSLKAWILRKDKTEYWWKVRTKCFSKNPITKVINRIKYYKLLNKHGSYIPWNVKFEGMPKLPHGPRGIFISDGAKIGKGCVIFHQVTIGSNTLADSRGKGSPNIGDNCYIGCGAKLIGGITVGNNVRIGANCVVTSDVPDNTTVVLNKPRMIQKETPQDNTFVSFHKAQH